MNSNQREWRLAKNRLAAALNELGYPDELADLMARQLKSPRAMERMTAYIHQAHPSSMEMLVDEMLAICAEAEAWREKRKAQEAQMGYNRWLQDERRESP